MYLGLTKYVTVMAGLAIDGIPFGGIIHKPFENKETNQIKNR